MDKLFSVENLVVIITGSGKGIGYTLSQSFAKNKAIVYSISLNFHNKIPKNLNKFLFQEKCDVRDEEEFRKICKKIYKKHGKIDVLINNAGITLTSSNNKNYSIDDWNKTLDVNLTGSFKCSNTVFGYMYKKNSGSIINITSINSELGFPKNPYYVASKGGLKMLTKALARDWGMYGIRVNNLGPGYFKTEMTKRAILTQEKENLVLIELCWVGGAQLMNWWGLLFFWHLKHLVTSPVKIYMLMEVGLQMVCQMNKTWKNIKNDNKL